MLKRGSIKVLDGENFVQVLPETVTDQVLDPETGEQLDVTLEKMNQKSEDHASSRVNSEQGVHGIRFFNGVLSVKMNDVWVEIFKPQ